VTWPVANSVTLVGGQQLNVEHSIHAYIHIIFIQTYTYIHTFGGQQLNVEHYIHAYIHIIFIQTSTYIHTFGGQQLNVDYYIPVHGNVGYMGRT
jgi:hypothetical protein